MTLSSQLITGRLVLRRWRPEDFAPFAAINADPVVMEYYPSPMSPAETRGLMDRIQANFDRHDYGLWAVEVPGAASFIGYVGLAPVNFGAFAPAVEAGWRLAKEHWGRGYATEAARAAVDFGFQQLGLEEIVAFTSTPNIRSQRVMERLGMTRDPADDFDHPNLAEGHHLRRHLLYRLRRPDRAPYG